MFEQTGVVEGKIQGRLKPTGIRPKFVEKFETRASTCPRASSASRTSGREVRRSAVEQMTLVVAGITALAILLIAFGLASSGGSSGVTARLERYASGKPEKVKSTASGQGAISDLLNQSTTLASLNKVVEQRDFGANLSRDLARADLKLKPSEFLFLWGATIVGIPLAMIALSVVFTGARQPAPVGHRRPRRRLAAAVLARSPQERPAERIQQAAARHDHPHRQRAAGRVVVPPGDRDGRPRVASADLARVRPGHP